MSGGGRFRRARLARDVAAGLDERIPAKLFVALRDGFIDLAQALEPSANSAAIDTALGFALLHRVAANAPRGREPQHLEILIAGLREALAYAVDERDRAQALAEAAPAGSA